MRHGRDYVLLLSADPTFRRKSGSYILKDQILSLKSSQVISGWFRDLSVVDHSLDTC